MCLTAYLISFSFLATLFAEVMDQETLMAVPDAYWDVYRNSGLRVEVGGLPEALSDQQMLESMAERASSRGRFQDVHVSGSDQHRTSPLFRQGENIWFPPAVREGLVQRKRLAGDRVDACLLELKEHDDEVESFGQLLEDHAHAMGEDLEAFKADARLSLAETYREGTEAYREASTSRYTSL